MQFKSLASRERDSTLPNPSVHASSSRGTVVPLSSSVAFPYAPVGESYGTAHSREQPHKKKKENRLPVLGPTVRLCRRVTAAARGPELPGPARSAFFCYECASVQARHDHVVSPRTFRVIAATSGVIAAIASPTVDPVKTIFVAAATASRVTHPESTHRNIGSSSSSSPSYSSQCRHSSPASHPPPLLLLGRRGLRDRQGALSTERIRLSRT